MKVNIYIYIYIHMLYAAKRYYTLYEKRDHRKTTKIIEAGA